MEGVFTNPYRSNKPGEGCVTSLVETRRAHDIPLLLVSCDVIVACCVGTVWCGSARHDTEQTPLPLLLHSVYSVARCLEAGCVTSVAQPNSGLTYHTAPSLRLFIPNSLTVYHRSFPSEGCARNVTSNRYIPVSFNCHVLFIVLMQCLTCQSYIFVMSCC
jgi:hypothetical protein